MERHPPDLGAGDLHLDRHGELVLPRPQRAGAVGQRLGQHRLDGSGHVHARRPPEGLGLQRPARAHVGRHVGDVHPQANHAVVALGGRDRVVEVAGVVGVDGEGGQLPQVDRARRSPDGLASSASASTRFGNARRRPRSSMSPSTTSRATAACPGCARCGRPACRRRPGPGRPADRPRRRARHARPARAEQRLGHQEAPALGEHSHQREVDPGRAPLRPRAHVLLLAVSQRDGHGLVARRCPDRRAALHLGLDALAADVLAARAGSTRRP